VLVYGILIIVESTPVSDGDRAVEEEL